MVSSEEDLTDKLLTKEVYIRMTFADNSQFCFKTTLNEDLLASYGIQLIEGCLPRIDKKYYVNGRFIYRQFQVDNAEKIELMNGIQYERKIDRIMHEFI